MRNNKIYQDCVIYHAIYIFVQMIIIMSYLLSISFDIWTQSLGLSWA